MTLREFHKKLQGFEILEKSKREAVEMNKEKIIRLNQVQLRTGKNANDKNIRPKYSKQYLKMKNKMTTYYPTDGTPDLYLTGAFQGEMDLIVESGTYTITSFDEKLRFLEVMYGDLFGLTKENIELAQVFVSRTFLEQYRKNMSN